MSGEEPGMRIYLVGANFVGKTKIGASLAR